MAEIPSWTRLRTVVAVADLGSVRDAAIQLHITESAVSAALSAVARTVGTELFARRGRGLELTPAGAVFADHARTLIGLADEALAAVQNTGHGRLRIGAVETASENVLPGLLARFHHRHPDVELTMSVLPRDDLFAALDHHEIDLAVAGRPPHTSDAVSRATRDNSLIVVAAPDHRTDIATATWLLRGPGSGTRTTASGLFNTLEISPPTLTLGTHGAVVAAAQHGLGVTLVHADAVRRDLAAGSLVRLDVATTPIVRPWHIVTHRSSAAAADLFLQVATDRGGGDDAFTTTIP